ncbi:hypothetical protein [Haloferula sp.]|uniref:hypothetical protein n=1 Tax=Haloferula sp. TaxID=2497595 RepID=UPI003C7475ED
MSKRKYPSTTERIAIFRAAWREIVPDATFAGMTLAEFEAEVEPVETNASRIESLVAQQAAALTERQQVDAAARSTMSLVVNAVRGDPAYGEDSQLYRAFGYVPKSERRSGLKRGAGTGSEDPPAEGEAT